MDEQWMNEVLERLGWKGRPSSLGHGLWLLGAGDTAVLRWAMHSRWGASTPPPPFVIATPKYGINTVPTPTVAWTRAWLAHDTYNYRHTCE